MNRNLLSDDFDPAAPDAPTLDRLRVGMRVRVTHQGSRYQRTPEFGTFWVAVMDYFVGQVREVVELSPHWGAKLNTSVGGGAVVDYWFPLQTLEIVP